MNLSQTRLAQLTGISERSLYTYEQLGTLPRKSNIRKLAEALHISVSYLVDDEETNSQSQIDEDIDVFFKALMSVYMDSKRNAREKFKRRGKNRIVSCYNFDEKALQELKILKFDSYTEE